MAHEEDISKLGAAKLAVAAQITKIIVPKALPTDARPDPSVQFAMATTAEHFALLVLVLPWLATGDVLLVVYLKNNAGFPRASTTGAGVMIPFKHFCPEVSPLR